MAISIVSCIFLLSSIFCCILAGDYPYKTAYFNQHIDHFNLMTYGDRQFRQKYLFQDEHWSPGTGPIFFYAGNEGPIEAFWGATGLVHEIAPEFGAYVVFPEHRYYGESLPFGNESFKQPYIGLLTVDQAMADYAMFLHDLKLRLKAPSCKIIAFGGSYGGMLAAYMRFKYPNIIDGSLAASAPIFMLDISGPHNFFFSHVTKDFRDIDEKCYDLVKLAFERMNDLAQQGQKGLDVISSEFQLCKHITDEASFRHLQGWVRNAFTLLAMLDYPYPTGFMGNVPGHPVKVACGKILNASNPLLGLAEAAGVYYNASSIKCYDIYDEFVECADPTGCGTGPAAIAWDYQACTDIILPSGSNNVTDMFPVLPWNLTLREEYCKKTFGIVPRSSWPEVQFLGEKIKSSSNIFFSNGDLDPWMGGGVLSNISETLVAMTVHGGAHHLDLRASNPLDPPGVIEVREMEKKYIRQWINSGQEDPLSPHIENNDKTLKFSCFDC